MSKARLLSCSKQAEWAVSHKNYYNKKHQPSVPGHCLQNLIKIYLYEHLKFRFFYPFKQQIALVDRKNNIFISPLTCSVPK